MHAFVLTLGLLSQHPPPTMQAELAAVAAIHGEAGPWAVAGFRMGQFALKRLGLQAQSHDLRLLHKSPASPTEPRPPLGPASAS